MWWSPDSTKIAFYRFDESKVPDYFLQMDQTKLYTKADIEAYPKAGQPNPDRRHLHLRRRGEDDGQGRRPRRQAVRKRRRRPLRLPRRPGRPTARSSSSTGRTAARTSWSSSPPIRRPGKCRVIIREEWPTGWVENSPQIDLVQGRQALHLGLGADRLPQFLSLRPQREAARDPDQSPLRGGRHRPARRGGRKSSTTWPATGPTT